MIQGKLKVQPQGRLIILTGKTASGKDTIKSALLNKYPKFKKVITTTSRIPRPNEKEGVDYYFLTRSEFEAKNNQGEFVEYVEYGGNLYGTYKTELKQALSFDLIWRIDPSRAGEVREFIKRSYPKELAEKLIKSVLVIYITTPSKVILERLQKRGLGEIEIQKRMADDERMWQQYKDNYDFIVDNIPGKLDKTLDKIEQIIG